MSRIFVGSRWAACGLIAATVTAGGQNAARPASDAIKRADAAFRAGAAARESGNLEVARQNFAEVVRLQPRIAEGHEALGTVLAEMGRPLDGAKEFEAAAKIKPADSAIESNLAMAYAQAGEPAKAIPHFRAADEISKQPQQTRLDAPFYDAYRRALAKAGKPAEAEKVFLAEEKLTGPRAEV